jgi:hypothetical protein
MAIDAVGDAPSAQDRGEICQVSIGELFFGQFVQGRLELRFKVRGTRPALPACGFCRSVRGDKTGRPRDLSRQYLVLYGTVDVEAIDKSREAKQR